jgi:hypothetical protein
VVVFLCERTGLKTLGDELDESEEGALAALVPVGHVFWSLGVLHECSPGVKSKFDASWNRRADLTGDCARNGESAPGGLYLRVTGVDRGSTRVCGQGQGPRSKGWVEVPQESGQGRVHARFFSNGAMSYKGVVLEGYE